MQQQLNKVQQILTSNSKTSGGLYNSSMLAADKKRITELQTALSKSYNSKLGVLNTKQFTNSISSLSQLAATFNRAGAAGQAAFSNLATKMSTIQIATKEVSSSWEKLQTTMANTARWGVTSAIFQGVTSSIMDAVSYVKELDESLTQITMVSGESRDNMKDFAEYANKAAASLGSSTTDYTNAVKVFVQEGFTLNESKEQATQATILGNVSEQDTSTTADEITAYRNAFGLSIEDMNSSLDKLANTANNTAADVGELMTAAQKAASTAAAVGASEDSFLASIATIQSVTRESAENIGNGLKSIYTRFADVSMGETTDDDVNLGQYAQALKSAGVNITDDSGNLKSMDTILSELQDVWDTLDNTKKVAVGEKVAGRYQYNRFAALMNNSDYYDKAYAATQNADGAMDQMQSDYMGGITGKTQKMMTNIETLFTQIYNSGIVERLVDGVGNLAQLFSDLASNMEDLFGNIDSSIPIVTTISALFLKLGGSSLASGIADSITNFDKQKAAKDELAYQQQKAKEIMSGKGVDAFGFTADNRYVQAGKNYAQRTQYADVMTEEQIANVNAELETEVNLINEAKQAEEELANAAKELQSIGTGTTIGSAMMEGMSEAEKNENYLKNINKEIVDINSELESGNLTLEEQIKKNEELEKLYKQQEETQKSLNVAYRNVIEAGVLAANSGNTPKGVEASKATKSANKNANSALKGVQSSTRRGTDVTTTARKNAKTAINQIGKSLSDDTAEAKKLLAALDKTGKGLEGTLEDLNKMKERLKDSTKLTKEETEALQQMMTAIKEASNTAIEEGELTPGQVRSKAREAGKASQRQQASENAQKAYSGRVSDSSKEDEKSLKLKNNIITVTTALGDLATAMMGAEMAATGLDTMFTTLTDDTATLEEKTTALTTGLINLTMGAGMLLSSVQSIATAAPSIAAALGMAEVSAAGIGASLAALLPIIAAFVAVITALGFAIKTIIDNVDNLNNASSRAAEAAQGTVTQLSTSITNLNNEIDDLKDRWDSLEESESALDGLTKGTAEWRDTVREVNQQVLELIETYPELASSVENVDGVLTVDETAYNDLVEKKSEQVTTYTNSLAAAQTAKTKANNKAQLQDVVKNNINNDLLSHAGTVLTGAALGGVTAGVAVGATAGTAIAPGIGTGAGAAIGAIGGAVAGILQVNEDMAADNASITNQIDEKLQDLADKGDVTNDDIKNMLSQVDGLNLTEEQMNNAVQSLSSVVQSYLGASSGSDITTITGLDGQSYQYTQEEVQDEGAKKLREQQQTNGRNYDEIKAGTDNGQKNAVLGDNAETVKELIAAQLGKSASDINGWSLDNDGNVKVQVVGESDDVTSGYTVDSLLGALENTVGVQGLQSSIVDSNKTVATLFKTYANDKTGTIGSVNEGNANVAVGTGLVTRNENGVYSNYFEGVQDDEGGMGERFKQFFNDDNVDEDIRNNLKESIDYKEEDNGDVSFDTSAAQGFINSLEAMTNKFNNLADETDKVTDAYEGLSDYVDTDYLKNNTDIDTTDEDAAVQTITDVVGSNLENDKQYQKMSKEYKELSELTKTASTTELYDSTSLDGHQVSATYVKKDDSGNVTDRVSKQEYEDMSSDDKGEYHLGTQFDAASEAAEEAQEQLEAYKKAAVEAQEAQYRLDATISDMSEDFDDVNSVLQSTNSEMKNSTEYVNALTKANSYLQGLLDDDTATLSKLSEATGKATGEISNLMNQAKNGDQSSLDQLYEYNKEAKQKEIKEEVGDKTNSTTTTSNDAIKAAHTAETQNGIKVDMVADAESGQISVSDAMTMLQQTADQLPVYSTINCDTSSALAALKQLYNSGVLTADQLKAIGSAMGLSFDLEYEQQETGTTEPSTTDTTITASLPDYEYKGGGDSFSIADATSEGTAVKINPLSTVGHIGSMVANPRSEEPIGSISEKTDSKAGKNKQLKQIKATKKGSPTVTTSTTPSSGGSGSKGSGGKSSSKKASVKKTARSTNTGSRTRKNSKPTITNKISEKLSSVMDKISKQNEKLYGKSKLNNMDQLIKKQEKYVKALQDEYKANKKNLDNLKQQQNSSQYNTELREAYKQKFSYTTKGKKKTVGYTKRLKKVNAKKYAQYRSYLDEDGNTSISYWSTANKNKKLSTSTGDPTIKSSAATNYTLNDKIKFNSDGSVDQDSYEAAKDEINKQVEEARIAVNAAMKGKKNNKNKKQYNKIIAAAKEKLKNLQAEQEEMQQAVESYTEKWEQCNELLDSIDEQMDSYIENQAQYAEEMSALNSSFDEAVDIVTEMTKLSKAFGSNWKKYYSILGNSSTDLSDAMTEAQTYKTKYKKYRSYASGSNLKATTEETKLDKANTDIADAKATRNIFETNNTKFTRTVEGKTYTKTLKGWDDFWQKSQQDDSMSQEKRAAIQKAYQSIREENGLQGVSSYEEAVNNYNDAVTAKSEIVSNMQSTADDLIQSAESLGSDLMDQYDTEISKIDDVIDQLDTIKDIKSVLEGSENTSTQIRIISEKITALNDKNDALKEELASAKKLAESYKDALGEDSTQYQDQLTTISDINSNILSNTSDILSNIQEKLEQQFQLSVEQLLEKMGIDSSSWITMEWELQSNFDDGWYDEYEKAYQIQTLKNSYQSLLDDETNLVTQRKISEQMNQQIKYLEDKTELSEYDVEYAQKQLDILKAQIALEDAQNNKNKMKLRRDASGNYSYAYTADENDVIDKQQDLLDAQNDAYELAKQRLQDASENIHDYVEQAAEDLATIYETYTGEEATKRSAEYLEQLQSYIKKTASNINDANNGIQESTEKMNKTLTELFSNNALDSLSSKIKDGTISLGDFGFTFEDQETFITRLTELSEKAGDLVEALKNDTNIIGSDYTESASDAASNVDLNDTKLITDTLSSIKLNISDITKNFDTNLSSIADALNTAIGLYEDLAKQDNNGDNAYDSTSKSAEEVQKVNNGTITASDGTTLLDSATSGISSSSSSSSSGTIKSGSTVTVKDTSAKVFKRSKKKNGKGYKYSSTTLKKGKKWKVKFNKKLPSGKRYVLSRTKTNKKGKKSTLKRYTSKAGLAKLTGRKVGFASGGYTGNWSDAGAKADDKRGKWALLHQKELVLNAKDTENMLKMLEAERAIANNKSTITPTLDLSSLSKSLANDTIEQRVQIDAQFPNAENTTEIKQALLSLADSAYSYANRTIK